MLIGVPKEIKNNEFRVGMTPESVVAAIAHGHQVIIETNAGIGIGADDACYEQMGATIAPDAKSIFDQAEMIVKVKEPQANERKMLRDGQILYTYLHLAPDPEQTHDLVDSGAICIAYETITDDKGALPMLKPMSQVAGRLSIQAGATALEKTHGGLGCLLGGVPGVTPAKVVIIGGGVVGFNAAQMAVGLQADVTILDTNANSIERLSNYFGASAKVIHSNHAILKAEVSQADLVIGAVLIPGSAAPKLVTKSMLGEMKSGAVLVDVAIDQGGCFETSKATTHADPTYIIDNIVHYCVANMPGAVPRTSTYALNNATLSGLLAIADKGWKQALKDDLHLRKGLNVAKGKVTYKAVAELLGYDYIKAESLLN
ncbi:MAG: alanine dehydrogenase [Gammaproteobacteria bacterium]|nr:alanine dehydrogenase [Gammaproteobacteria bacterium]